MQEYARICKNMQEYARICKNMQEYARICKNMQLNFRHLLLNVLHILDHLATLLYEPQHVTVHHCVRLRACTKTGTILANTIQFLFKSYPNLCKTSCSRTKTADFRIHILPKKYWGKQIFAHGRFPEVGQKQKTERKNKEETERW